MASHGLLRITKEVTNIQRNDDLSLAVEYSESDLKRCLALIIGPPDTPYQFGYFIFEIKFGKDYPTSPPEVRALTTNSELTRFNPNIYAEGKVCLSILGTWRGEPGEQWSSAQGLESILISIQSLLSANPYTNEPGFEDMERERDKVEAPLYARKITHETLRIAVIQQLEKLIARSKSEGGTVKASRKRPRVADDVDSSIQRREQENQQTVHSIVSSDSLTKTFIRGDDDDPTSEPFEFEDLCKCRFLWYYASYLKTVDENFDHAHSKEGTRFPTMQFEHEQNKMQGLYEYKTLRKRLENIHADLRREMEDMEQQGLQAAKNESPDAFALENRLKHLKTSLEQSSSTVDLEHIPDNPFVWRLTIFGKTTSLLEGGIFGIKIIIPVDFPIRQPRVRMETPIFHHRVAPDGTICYFPSHTQEIEPHVHAIIASIQDEDPRYDPRTLVNPEASSLLWGSEADKKTYRRRLRRSAEQSSEI